VGEEEKAMLLSGKYFLEGTREAFKQDLHIVAVDWGIFTANLIRLT
jgi:hypothetical protein